jgi:hypothetical protein
MTRRNTYLRVSKNLSVPTYDEVGDRFCPKCLDYKPLSEFYAVTTTGGRGGKPYISYRCKIHNRAKSKVSRRKATYGITGDEFSKMKESQGNCCYMCGEPQVRKDWDLAVDHCHKTGKVRKLLCNNCNVGLAMFKDNPELLRAAAQYIDDHQKEQA